MGFRLEAIRKFILAISPAKAKSLGFSDRQIAHLTGTTEDAVRAERKQLGLVPSYRLVDTYAAEFEAYTPHCHQSPIACSEKSYLKIALFPSTVGLN